MAIFTPYSAPNAALIPQPGLLGGAPPKSAPPAPQQQGLFSRILANLGTPQGMQILGSGLRDLSDGGNSLPALNQQILEQQRQQSADAWQRMQQEHTQLQWTQQNDQTKAQDAAAAAAPENLRSLAQADPEAYVQGSLTQALRPTPRILTPAEARAQGLQPGTVAQLGPNGVDVVQNPRAPSAAQQQADSFTPEDINYYAQAGLAQGGLPRFISVRSPLVPRLLHRMRELASQQNIPASRLASIEAAYHGDRTAYGKLNETYNNVVAFERTTDAFLSNLQSLARQVPANQITDSGFMNNAIQQYNHGVRQSPALSAYIGALVSTRMELARTLGGSVSPPVESMHDAEAILPNDIGYHALQDRNGVSTNIHNEMQLRGQSLRGTLDDIQGRIENGELVMPGGPPAAGGNSQPPAPSSPSSSPATRTRTYNPATGRLE